MSNNNSNIPGLILNESVSSAGTPVNPLIQALIFGRRTTEGALIQPPAGSGYSMPNLFVPFQLPAFDNGTDAVNYLVNNFGYKVIWGVNFTTILPAPSIISAVQSDGSYILIWSVIPNNFAQLTQISLTGSITQGSDTGIIAVGSVQINNNTATMRIMPNGSSTFNTTDIITVSGTNNIQKPNPVLSDEICAMVFAFYNQAIVFPGGNNPNVWISVLNDNCTTVNPANIPSVIGIPDTVTVNADTSVTLTYLSTAADLGWLTTTPLGNSITTQDTSLATGVYNGYFIDSLGNVEINIINITGTFDTINIVSVQLDVTQSAFNFIGQNQICNFILPFEIKLATDLTVTQSTFYNNILTLNNGQYQQQGQFLAQGYFANLTPKAQVLNLPSCNSQYFKATWKSDQPSLLDYPETPGSVASASSYMDLQAPVPFNSSYQVNLNLSVSSNANTYPSTSPSGGDCYQAFIQGWTAIYVNSSGLSTCYLNTTQMITIPNTSIVSTELRLQAVWLKQRWLQQQVTTVWQSVTAVVGVNAGTVLNSAKIRKNMLRGIQGVLFKGQTLGILQNVNAYVSLVTVIVNPDNANGIIVTLPNQVVPELINTTINVTLFSSLYNFTSSTKA